MSACTDRSEEGGIGGRTVPSANTTDPGGTAASGIGGADCEGLDSGELGAAFGELIDEGAGLTEGSVGGLASGSGVGVAVAEGEGSTAFAASGRGSAMAKLMRTMTSRERRSKV